MAHRPLPALVGAAFLYGTTFVVVKDAVAVYPPVAFVGWRFLLGAAALALVAVPRGRKLWRDGAVAGTLLFAGYAFQTMGLTETSASNSALLTGLFVVITPLLAAAAGRRLPGLWETVGGMVAFVGVALLTRRGELSIGTGDLLTVACSFMFAAHIVVLAHLARRHPVVPLTVVQLVVTAALAFLYSLPVEGRAIPPSSVWPAIVLTGLGVSAGASLLQLWAQVRVGPGRTAVVLALEPVFGVATAALLIGERLDIRGWAGACLILGAIYLSSGGVGVAPHK